MSSARLELPPEIKNSNLRCRGWSPINASNCLPAAKMLPGNFDRQRIHAARPPGVAGSALRGCQATHEISAQVMHRFKAYRDA